MVMWALETKLVQPKGNGSPLAFGTPWYESFTRGRGWSEFSAGVDNRRVVAPRMAHLYGPDRKQTSLPSCGTKDGSLIRTRREIDLTAELWHRGWLTYTDPTGNRPHRRVVAPRMDPSDSGNEFAVEDEGDFDATGAAESTAVAIQPPFASLERLGVQISAVPAEGEADFYGYSVPREGIQFLEAMWKNQKMEECVVQELMKEGFRLDFIFEHFPRLLETYLAKGIAAGITAEAAYGVVAEAADDVVGKVVDAVILEIIGNASNLREIPVVGNSPQDRDCDLGRCETTDFYEFLLALMGVHHSFIVASANIVMIGKECMNVVGTTELIAGAIAEPSTTDL
uniref:Uncharacterized protein n=1 Tax=Fagus sylvatica TaxID=28930 RepID=A0A2N9FDZ4_FAGSY